MRVTFQPRAIRLIAGIGNPEERYANTYHNAGLQFVSYCNEVRPPLGGRTSNPIFFSSPVSMNCSGGVVQKALSRVSAKPEALLLVHDDSDLALGTYRVSFGSGSAGHRGVQSVIEALGTNEFFRLRFGIRDPGSHHKKRAKDFVLRALSPQHKKLLEKAFASAASKFNFLS